MDNKDKINIWENIYKVMMNIYKLSSTCQQQQHSNFKRK